MTLTRRRKKLLTVVAVIAVVVCGYLAVRQLTRSTFPGTDVEYFHATVSPYPECQPYRNTLQSLVDDSPLIVLGTITSERQLFEPVYGTDLPRKVDGELPPRRSDYLAQVVEIDVEEVLSGTPPDSLQVQDRGWLAENNSDTWHRYGVNGSPTLSTGDRAVVPLFLSIDKAPGLPMYAVSCTGAFLLEDGWVQPRDDGREFTEDGVYSMSEEQLLAAIRELARLTVSPGG